MGADLARVRSAVARFEATISSAAEFDEVLASEYDRLKRSLAVNFQALALEAIARDEYRLAEVKAAVTDEMKRLFAGRVDSRFFKIGGYSRPHPDIYALLASRVGTSVPGWRIRLLSGDKIHTERRTRELRDLGLVIDIAEGQESSSYRLDSLQPDLTYGAAFQLRKNALAKSKGGEQDRLIEIAEDTADLPERKRS